MTAFAKFPNAPYVMRYVWTQPANDGARAQAISGWRVTICGAEFSCDLPSHELVTSPASGHPLIGDPRR